MQDFVKPLQISSAQKEQEIIAFSIMDGRAMTAEFLDIDLNNKKRKLDETAEEEIEIDEESEDDYIDVVSTLGLGSLAVAN